MKPTIRVTLLESFRRYMFGDYSYVSEQDVIDSVMKVFVGNEYTWIGTTFHGIVETGKVPNELAPAGERKYIHYKKEQTEPIPEGKIFILNGKDEDKDKKRIIFDNTQIYTALKYRSRFPDAFHEVREYKDYGNAIVTGCADLIYGNQIRDIKTKFSPISDDEYINSYQWRYYLDLFGADEFHFDLFVFSGYDKNKHSLDVRGVPLTKHEPSITCYRYSRLETDIKSLLDKFIDWATYRQLLKYLS